MDLSKWEAGECSYCDGGVNYGVAEVMLGFGQIASFIGRVGKYNLILSPCQMVSRCLPTGGSNLSIGDVLSIGGIPMVKVMPSI